MLWIVIARSRARPVGVVQIGGRERRLPVVRVNDLRPVVVDRAEADVRADPRKRREPAGVVGPVQSVGTKVGIARPVVEMRRVDGEQVEAGRVTGKDSRRAAEQIGVIVRRLSVGELGHHRRVGGNDGPDLNPFAGERRGQRADDVGEPASLDERENLRGDGENFQLAHCASLSIMGWVIKVTPLSVRRNRLASSSGSSPTTRPSGIRTSLSMMALTSRALRPIVT